MGKLTIVGIGPGNYDNMTIAADRALRESQLIVGYTVYVDLVQERYPGKELLSTPMTREAERCTLALEEAETKNVALVCSGDSGIYGMAAGQPHHPGNLRGARADCRLQRRGAAGRTADP